MKAIINRVAAYFFLEAVEFFNAPSVKAKMDADSRMLLESDQFIIEEGNEYLTKEVTALSGTVDLITSTTNRKVGAVSFHQAKLASRTNMAVYGIGFGFGSHATEVDSAKITYGRTKSGVDNALLRANLIIQQDGQTLLKRQVADVMADSLEDGVGANYLQLKNWALIKADRELNVKLEFPEGQSVANDKKYHVEVKLYGFQTRVRV